MIAKHWKLLIFLRNTFNRKHFPAEKVLHRNKWSIASLHPFLVRKPTLLKFSLFPHSFRSLSLLYIYFLWWSLFSISPLSHIHFSLSPSSSLSDPSLRPPHHLWHQVKIPSIPLLFLEKLSLFSRFSQHYFSHISKFSMQDKQ